MLAGALLAFCRLLPERTLRRGVPFVFARTTAALEAACADPAAAQWKRLQQILRTNADTEFGRAHGFDNINSLDAFRQQVPLSSWESVEPAVTRMLKGERGVLVAEDPIFYATSSGTTGRRKLIPVTAGFVDECRVANRVLYRTILEQMPALLKGKRLALRSPETEELRPGVLAGSITVALGGTADEDGALDAVPLDVFRLRDPHARYFLALRCALEQRVTVCSAINPSTLLLFARTLAEHAEDLAQALEAGTLGVTVEDAATRERLQKRVHARPEIAARLRASARTHGAARMQDAFPSLAGLVTWKGGSAPWFIDRLTASYGALPTVDYGYCASEGCFGAPLSCDGAASLLLPHGHVVELIPEDDGLSAKPGTVSLEDARVGARYLVVITTGGGLYRYQMQDVVEVVGQYGRAPLVTFLHKAGAMGSLTGEKLGESHVAKAVADAGLVARGFVTAPVLPLDNRLPHWVLAVDGDLSDDELAAAAVRTDAAFSAANEEYDRKRKTERLGPLEAVRLPPDAIAQHRHARVGAGAPDAHVKIPLVSADGALLLLLGIEKSAPQIAAQLPCRRGRP